MGEIVNLNRARKSRAKAGQKTEAVANRIAHGRTKVEKQAANLDQAAPPACWTARSATRPARIDRQVLGARISMT